ncbi:MAG: DUF3857 domain-containing protein [Candidatus Krumholzibacteria bacterium]|nr:DUF3857 domain-containing protein [Candidatus Krumholzibacteria bacterium]
MALRNIGTQSCLRLHHYLLVVSLTAFLAVFLCGNLANASPPDRCAARRDDAQIKKLVGQLEDKLAKKTGLDQEPAVVLYGCREFDSTRESHVVIHNIVVKINEPDHELVRTRTLGFSSEATIEFTGGWIWRDGKVIHLEESNRNIDKTGGISPQDVVFSFPDLEKGDVVCYSVEAKKEHPYMGSHLRMSCDLPVMLCNTRVKTGGFFSLEFLGHNLVSKKYGKKVYKEKDGYPIDIKFTVVDIPADKKNQDAPMFYEYQPFLIVYPKAQYNDMTEAWMETSSWNMVAVFASGYRARIQEKSSVVKAKARELTADLTTDAEKADALYKFVQDDIKMVCFFDDYYSSKLEDILVKHEANRFGKSALMYAMCLSLDLPVDVLLSRDRQLGHIDRTTCAMDQFTDFIIILEGEPARYYVPTTDPCITGELPKGLRGLNALSTKPDLKDPFRKLAIEAMSRSSGNPQGGSAIFNSLLNEQDWSEWIILP